MRGFIGKKFWLRRLGYFREKKCVKGSFTVEAAFVGPVIIFLIIVAMYIGFSFYNQSVTKNYCAYAAQLLSQSAFKYICLPEKVLNTEQEFEVTWRDDWENSFKLQVENVSKAAKEDLNSVLLLGKIENLEITYQYHTLTEEVVCEVTANGTTLFPMKLFGKKQLDFFVKSQGKAYDETKLLWKTKVLKGDDQSD